MPPRPPLSILDLALIARGQTAGDAFAGCVAVARQAEAIGYRRIWYAEHHNMGAIGSSATSVLIEHIASKTKRIRIGAGGIMLPNHAPLVIAEQFGTLDALHPGRIDLGLGRAPGTDPTTTRALRRGATSSDTFPDDVLELQGYLEGHSRVPGVEATPGRGSGVPLYILGSSLFGADFAASMGLPYAFASHFAPAALTQAITRYRSRFRPSKQLEKPYVLAGVTVIASDTREDAEAQRQAVRRSRARLLLGRGQPLTDAEVDALVESPAGEQLDQMMTYAALGTKGDVHAYLDEFARHANADELITVHPSPTLGARLRSIELTMEGWSGAPQEVLGVPSVSSALPYADA